jgi:hypothetical protein
MASLQEASNDLPQFFDPVIRSPNENARLPRPERLYQGHQIY